MNFSTMATHKKKVKKIALQIKTLRKENNKKTIRFTHGSTNSTRVQDKSASHIIDISNLDEIISIDKKNKTAVVEPNVPMDKLVDYCLQFGLLPKVVMEFPGITCGGAVNGAALEASSFKYGQFNDICKEYEVILGNGEIHTVNSKKNSDLFYALSGSYGSIALLTLITIELVSAKEYVSVTFTPVDTPEITQTLSKTVKTDVDYVEGIILNEKASMLITGKLSNHTTLPVKTFSKASDDWFITYVNNKKNTTSNFLVPIKDYLFRYNRGAFWMGQHAFNLYYLPNNKVTRFMLNPFMNTRTMYQGLHDTNIAQTLFIQDFYVPLSQSNSFIQTSIDTVQIFPIWLCPVKPTRNNQKLSPHYLSEKMLIDVGIWGPLPKTIVDSKKINILFEKLLKKVKGRKMFYAEAFYTEKEFWNIYDKKWYFAIRKKYMAENTFPTIFEKVTVKKRYPVNKKMILKTVIRKLQGK